MSIPASLARAFRPIRAGMARLKQLLQARLPKAPSEEALVAVLVSGFGLIVLLLLAVGITSVRSLRSIERGVGDVVDEFERTVVLVEELRHEQAALTAILDRLTREPDVLDPERIQADLDNTTQRIGQLADELEASGLAVPIAALQQSVAQFAQEARALLETGEASVSSFQRLFAEHQRVSSIIWQMLRVAHAQAQASEQELRGRSEQLLSQASILLGACFLLAISSAFLTVRFASRLLNQMESQRTELARVSWQMLHNQEQVASRLSHELHDELGQTLTALKLNLVSATRDPASAGEWLRDSLQLVDEALSRVREFTHLLRPPILDDFGLPAALRWLGERFQERTGIQVDVRAGLSQRLSEEVETHLFRIAQEALTNAARHAGASRVQIDLQEQNGQVRLAIEDNGRGLPEPLRGHEGLGLVAMRARARVMNGRLHLHSKPGAGLRIEVVIPRVVATDEEPTGQEDPRFARR